jgi:alpha-L-fucosidase
MKNIRILCVVTSIFLIAIIGCCNQGNPSCPEYGSVSYEATWQSLSRHETPEWYEDAVFGIYFHWGVYSVPAFGCWGGRNMYQPNGGRTEEWGHIDKDKYVNTYDYVKQVYGEPGTEFGYKDFIPMFKAEKWDPDKWAELFKEAGADFAGPVAIHHDGFAMWDSDVAEYNSMDMGPHRDVVGEMFEAVRKQDMKTFASFHYYTNWDFFNPGRKICPQGVDVNDRKYEGLYAPVREYDGEWGEEPISENFQKGWYNRVIEVIVKYCPDQLWFEIGFSDPDCIGQTYVKSALAHYFNTAEALGRQVVVTRKSDDLPLSCSVLNLEAHSEDKAQPVIWQTDIALGTNHAWAYSPDAVCRPINGVIDEIVDRKSKNGVTLLSLAPKPDGTLPPSQIDGLKELGKWMTVNKEALYACLPAPFMKGGTDDWKAGSIRFTEKGKYLYAIELGNELEEENVSAYYEDSTPPCAPYVIPGVKPLEGSKIRMLGSSENLPWHLEGDKLVIEKIPDPLPCEYAWTFKIKIQE